MKGPEYESRLSIPLWRGVESEWLEVDDRIWKPAEGPRSVDPVVSVARSLFDQPRWIEASFLYDEKGSHLFEQICQLPEYYLTRTEEGLLKRHSDAILNRAPVEYVVELGAGFSSKTRFLLTSQQKLRGGGTFVPIDVSRTGLLESRRQIDLKYRNLSFAGLHSDYEQGLEAVSSLGPKLVVFLGSSIGNLMRRDLLEFLEALRVATGPEDFLLLGVDCVKDPVQIERAYNDSQGLTADFILNSLDHLNKLVGTSFETNRFRYRVQYNQIWQQVEMFAEATCRHQVAFPAAGLSLRWREGECLLAEVSRKFIPQRLEHQLRYYGFVQEALIQDPNDWFALLLLKKTG